MFLVQTKFQIFKDNTVKAAILQKSKFALEKAVNNIFMEFLKTISPKQIDSIFNELIGIPIIIVKLWEDFGDFMGKTIILPVKSNEILAWDESVIVINK